MLLKSFEKQLNFFPVFDQNLFFVWAPRRQMYTSQPMGARTPPHYVSFSQSYRSYSWKLHLSHLGIFSGNCRLVLSQYRPLKVCSEYCFLKRLPFRAPTIFLISPRIQGLEIQIRSQHFQWNVDPEPKAFTAKKRSFFTFFKRH